MSRIGKNPVLIGAATVKQDGATLSVEGPKGKLSLTLPSVLSASMANGAITIARATDDKQVKALHGLYRALTANMVKGVTDGYSKELEVVGVGFRAQVQGKTLSLYVGFSHPVVFQIPEGVTIETPKPTIIVVKGFDKQLVGQLAANIRRCQPPEPYKGKGVKYAGEVIRRKAGKAATGAKGGAGGAK